MRFLRDKRGASALLFALLLPMMLGIGAITIDVSYFQFRKAQLQSAADAAALGAALKLPDLDAARAAAISIAGQNTDTGAGEVTRSSDVVFGVFDAATGTFTAGATNVNALSVTTNLVADRGNAENTILAQIWGTESVDITARAIAVGISPGMCFFVLDPGGKDAFQISGNGKVSVPNCGVQVNSTNGTALNVGNSGTLATKRTCVVGGYNGNNVTPTPETGCDVVPDPLASLPEPSQPTPTCFNAGDLNISGSYTFVPNQTYCHKVHISGNANVTVPAGLYYFKNADVKFSNSSSISGSGVTFFFDKDSKIDISSSGTINLTAPTTGTYKGILFFHSRLASGPGAHDKITGSPTLLLGGTLYMPTVFLEMAGNGTVEVNAKSGYVIAKRYKYTGSIEFKFDNWGGSIPSALAPASTLIN